MIAKFEPDILQLEDFFLAVRNQLVLKKSWICYIEPKLEPATLNSKAYICLFGEGGSDMKQSSGQVELQSFIQPIDDNIYNNCITMLGLDAMASVSDPKKISIGKDQDFGNFLAKYKSTFLPTYQVIERKRNLECQLPVKPGETKQAKI